MNRSAELGLAAVIGAAALASCTSVVVIDDSAGATAVSAASSVGVGGTIGVGTSSVSVGGGGGASGSTVTAASGTGGAIEVPVLDQAVAYQIDVGHSGAQTNDTLMPPLTQRWSVELGGTVSYPLIAEGRVFVVVSKKPLAGTQLYALDQVTGAIVWGPVEFAGLSYGANATYGGGKIFALNREGLVCAYDSATGAESWCHQSDEYPICGLPPVAFAGRVYACGGAGVVALSQATGDLLWKYTFEASLWTSPSVSASGVYVSFGVHRIHDLDPATGTLLWKTPEGPTTIGSRLTALVDGVLYERADSPFVGKAYDGKTGAELGDFKASRSPAFHGGRGFFMNDNVLSATAVPAFVEAWSFTAPMTLSMAPIVVNGHVYVGEDSGKIYALDEQSGAVVWSTDVGEMLPSTEPGTKMGPLQALAAGGGALIVPVNHRVVAFW
jgi:outer membrane protein assembly factor BamB